MTQETLHRFMKAALKKAQKVLNQRIYGEPKRNDLEDLEHDISNALAIVEAEEKHVKRNQPPRSRRERKEDDNERREQRICLDYRALHE